MLNQNISQTKPINPKKLKKFPELFPTVKWLDAIYVSGGMIWMPSNVCGNRQAKLNCGKKVSAASPVLSTPVHF